MARWSARETRFEVIGAHEGLQAQQPLGALVSREGLVVVHVVARPLRDDALTADLNEYRKVRQQPDPSP
jgi:hypothetical protein